MNEVLIWEQGGQTNVIFARHIINIVENETNGNKYCDIFLSGHEEPFKTSLTLSEILTQLNITRQ